MPAACCIEYNRSDFISFSYNLLLRSEYPNRLSLKADIISIQTDFANRYTISVTATARWKQVVVSFVLLFIYVMVT